jgi:LacI family transcriptional regulator
MAGVTLSDVARRAGVSQATASRVLNGSSRVPGEEVAGRVRSAAAELGYVPHAQAQALARRVSGLLGLVVHDIADPYFSTIAHGVQRAARRRGLQTLLASTERERGAEREAVEAFIAHRTDGLILVGSRTREGQIESELAGSLGPYLGRGGRLVVVGQALEAGSCVSPRNAEGAAELAGSLVEAGHRRFAVLSGPEHLRTASDRFLGFTSALARYGLRPEAVITGEFTRDGGYEAAGELVQLARTGRTRGPLCVFAVNDVMAIGAIARWRAEGLAVPKDLCAAGFDDIPTLQDHVPSLTTVRLPLVELGEHAVRLLFDRPDTGPGPDGTGHDGRWHIEVDTTVVVRESTDLSRWHGGHERGEEGR